MVRRMIEEMKPENIPSLAALKAAVKRQAFVLALDEERAIAALPKLAPDMGDAAAAASTRRGRSMSARGELTPQQTRALPRVAAFLAGIDRPASELKSALSHEKYQRLIDAAKALPPVATAVAHPCSANSLAARGGRRQAGPDPRRSWSVPRAKIEAVAKELEARSRGAASWSTRRTATPPPPRRCSWCAQGKAEALMKGSLHTDELMGAVVKRDTGLRTARRISHCFVLDVPSHPDALIISDAAVNIAPTLEDKVDIVQNAIDLGHALRFPEVRVAILSAVETVNPKIPSTIEAAALCKMADRGQITGGVLDGPLALDNAISLEAAAIKKIVSPVAGRANVLIVPDLEAGNMLAKSLSILAHADCGRHRAGRAGSRSS